MDAATKHELLSVEQGLAAIENNHIAFCRSPTCQGPILTAESCYRLRQDLARAGWYVPFEGVFGVPEARATIRSVIAADARFSSHG